MTDYGTELLGKVKRLGAVVETSLCLPEGVAVAIKELHDRSKTEVINQGKVAATFYDRDTNIGFRIWLDHRKTADFPRIHRWFLRLGRDIKDKKKRYEAIIEEMKSAGREVLSVKRVRIKSRLKRETIRFCDCCGEPFLAAEEQAKRCKECIGEGYLRS